MVGGKTMLLCVPISRFLTHWVPAVCHGWVMSGWGRLSSCLSVPSLALGARGSWLCQGDCPCSLEGRKIIRGDAGKNQMDF